MISQNGVKKKIERKWAGVVVSLGWTKQVTEIVRGEASPKTIRGYLRGSYDLCK